MVSFVPFFFLFFFSLCFRSVEFFLFPPFVAPVFWLAQSIVASLIIYGLFPRTQATTAAVAAATAVEPALVEVCWLLFYSSKDFMASFLPWLAIALRLYGWSKSTRSIIKQALSFFVLFPLLGILLFFIYPPFFYFSFPSGSLLFRILIRLFGHYSPSSSSSLLISCSLLQLLLHF